MKNLYKKILKEKRKEAKNIRRSFDEQMVKAAAFSVGREFRSVQYSIAEAKVFPILIELKGVLFPKPMALENFHPLKILSELLPLGLNVGAVVATDERYLGGNISWPNLVKYNANLPIICRDFFVHKAQVYQSRAVGADALLLDYGFSKLAGISEVLEAASEMALEIFIELGDSRETITVDEELFTGVIQTLPEQGSRPLSQAQVRALVEPLPASRLKIARFFPKSADELALLQHVGFDALLLSDAYWKAEGSWQENFATIMSWAKSLSDTA